MYSDLNDFIADLDKRKLLSRVRDSVSPDLEIAAVTDRVCKTPGGGPGLLFERPTGFDMPVATNLFGSLERMCLALGVNALDEVAREIDDLMTPKMPTGMLDAFKMLPILDRLRDLMPKTVKDAACQEVVKRDGSLDELPILKCWPEDGGRYITFPLVITKDPETGVRNMGTYRMQVFDGRTTGMHWQRQKRRAASPRGGAPRQETRSRRCAQSGSHAGLFGHGANARRSRRISARRISRPAPHRARQGRDRGPRSAGERAHRPRRLRRAGRAAARRPVRRSHGLLLAGRRLSGVSSAVHHDAKKPVYLTTTVVGIPPQEDYYLGKASERIFLPMIRKTLPEIVDMHFPAEGIFTTSCWCRSTSAIRGTRGRS